MTRSPRRRGRVERSPSSAACCRPITFCSRRWRSGDPRSTTPVGFVLAFGPRASELNAHARVGLADVDAERAFERARSAELEVLRAKTRGLESGAANSPNGAPAAEAA